jgi:hypothetical protein
MKTAKNILAEMVVSDTLGMEKMVNDHPDLGPDLVRAHLEIMRENGDEIPASLLALEKVINRPSG